MKTDHATKQQRLAEIVSGLGENATPSEIRERAYRVGFGVISQWMLIKVRNTLWPARKKHSKGFTRDERASRAEAESLRSQVVPCLQCASSRVCIPKRYRRKDGLLTVTRVCNDCGYRWNNREENTGPIRPRQADRIQWALLTEKKCSYCKRVLPVEAFSLQWSSKIARRPGCKECINEIRSRTQAESTLKRHGMSVAQYQSMLDSQWNRCAICRTTSTHGPIDIPGRTRKRRVFSVDHCHETGMVRGLLCARCNLAIGNFGDDTTVMRAAIDYIERHRNPDDDRRQEENPGSKASE